MSNDKYSIDSLWIDRRFGLEVKIADIEYGLNSWLYKVKYTTSEYTDIHNIEYMNKYYIESTAASRLLYIDSNKDAAGMWRRVGDTLWISTLATEAPSFNVTIPPNLAIDFNTLRGKTFDNVIIDEVSDIEDSMKYSVPNKGWKK